MRWRRVRQRRMVRAHLDGMTQSLDGVLWSVGRDFVILKTPRLVDEQGQSVSLDGDTLIPRERVTFLQTL